jgi:hypothetical protein
MTQMIDMRKVVDAYSIQTIMESSDLYVHWCSNSLNRQIEKRAKSHYRGAGSDAESSIDLSVDEREMPSDTSIEYSNVMTKMTLRLSQMMRL